MRSFIAECPVGLAGGELDWKIIGTIDGPDAFVQVPLHLLPAEIADGSGRIGNRDVIIGCEAHQCTHRIQLVDSEGQSALVCIDRVYPNPLHFAENSRAQILKNFCRVSDNDIVPVSET
ncbi:hypothetical protein AB4072_11495 [Microvirga sp. 2MCAF38]|uniref:hypothetical protein n=1 Tax=Microvirga sp. 2MCAF38 TaxID=3232989 RepID=UPI003F975792